MSDDDIRVTVCAACLQASCWQGLFMCQGSRSANTTQKTVRELRELNRESPDYWLTDVELARGVRPGMKERAATRTPAPAAAQGESFAAVEAEYRAHAAAQGEALCGSEEDDEESFRNAQRLRQQGYEECQRDVCAWVERERRGDLRMQNLAMRIERGEAKGAAKGAKGT